MTIATDRPIQQKPLSFEEFLIQYGDDDRYELIDGEVFDLEPTGPHEEVAAEIGQWLNFEIIQNGLNYFIPHRCLIKPLTFGTGFRPDVIVLDRAALINEPLWSREPVITLGSTVKFVAEVVSGNWQNDYARKFEDYASMGIPEYWIADHAALGGAMFLGKPKQPTLSICILNQDGEYDKQVLRGIEPIISPTFPGLKLTAAQVLGAGR
jgi:Uma2 family endonuclease